MQGMENEGSLSWKVVSPQVPSMCLLHPLSGIGLENGLPDNPQFQESLLLFCSSQEVLGLDLTPQYVSEI